MIHINITFCRFTMCMLRGKMEYKANLVSVLMVAIPLIVCTIYVTAQSSSHWDVWA